MAKRTQVVKAINVNGKLYRCPKHAAKRWVQDALARIYHRANNEAGYGSPRSSRAWNRYWDKRLRKRYYQLALPIMERLLR